MFLFFKQKTAYEMRISDWSSDVCSSDFGQHTTLELNTLGDPESRKAYRAALVDYFSAYRDELSDDSRDRLTRNPLRILDSKDKGDRKLIEQAPLFGDYLHQQKERKDVV